METERMKPTLIANWLKQNGVSQEKFAQMCDVSHGFIHQLLHGKYTDVANSVLRRMSAATGYDIEKLSEELDRCTEHNKEESA